jgi:hypothetical protein
MIVNHSKNHIYRWKIQNFECFSVLEIPTGSRTLPKLYSESATKKGRGIFSPGQQVHSKNPCDQS